MSYFSYFKNTSIFIGVFFCLGVLSCEEKQSTPHWAQETLPAPKEEKNSTQKHQSYKPVRFISYNLKNYLTMPTTSNSGTKRLRSKSLNEINALIQIITEAKPDILGICEIGNTADLQDLQLRLKQQKLNLPHAHITQGSDELRSLAILSKYPLTQTVKAKELFYNIGDMKLQISRGILDTTIQLPEREVRFIGAHLKSKRPSRTADQEIMRRKESGLLRKHIDTILNESPNTQLIVYGDFNDTKRSPTLDTLRGRRGSSLSLQSIELKDPQGDSWTHYWKHQGVYSRFDYVMANPVAKPHIDKKQSGILSPKNWNTASDHRPLFILIK